MVVVMAPIKNKIYAVVASGVGAFYVKVDAKLIREGVKPTNLIFLN